MKPNEPFLNTNHGIIFLSYSGLTLAFKQVNNTQIPTCTIHLWLFIGKERNKVQDPTTTKHSSHNYTSASNTTLYPTPRIIFLRVCFKGRSQKPLEPGFANMHLHLANVYHSSKMPQFCQFSKTANKLVVNCISSWNNCTSLL